MSSVDSPVSPIPSPIPHARAARTLLRWVCTSNPLYAVSAALFLFGLWASFGGFGGDPDAAALSAGLAGYTLLLVGAALLLVRLAAVWDDVRTVLLLVVLLLLATSVTFDELLVMEPERGRWYFVGGLAFAAVLSEVLLGGIRLRLPLLFRVPYHLALALFFLYPLALVRVVRDPHGEALMWGLWGFAPAAGLVLLTLLPAARRGRDYLSGNGSPWPWPFYPWSLFVFLALAACGRAVLLCWSFHLLPVGGGQLVFGPYFLVPLGLAVAVIVLELGLVEGSRGARWAALVAPAGLAALSAVGHRADPVYAEFLGHFAARLGGTPLFVSLVAAGAFYVYAWVRRVPLAPEGLTAVLAALAFVGPEALTARDLSSAPRPAFLAAALAVQAWVGLWRRDGWRLAAGAAVAAGWAGVAGWGWYRVVRAETPALDYLALGLLLLPLAVLVSLAKGGALSRWVGRAARGLPARTAGRG